MHFALSRQWGKIDYRVWISLMSLAFISLVLLGYKVAITVKCPAITLKVNSNLSHTAANTFYIDEQLSFTALVSAVSPNVIWNFGDSTAQQSGTTVSYTFTKEGNYLVTAKVNGKCAESLNIRIIQNNSSLTDNNAPTLNPIVSNDIVNIGEETIFNTSLSSQTYTWSVDEMPELGKITTPTAKFIFPKPGNFTIALLLDNGKSFRKIIQVNDPLANTKQSNVPLPPATIINDAPPAPAEPVPVPEKKPETTEVSAPPSKTYDQLPIPAIQAMLEQVINGKKSVADFDNILCSGAGTKVMANNESTTFAQLCDELRDKKGVLIFKRKRKIESVKVVRDEANGNCVKILYVDYK